MCDAASLQLSSRQVLGPDLKCSESAERRYRLTTSGRAPKSLGRFGLGQTLKSRQRDGTAGLPSATDIFGEIAKSSSITFGGKQISQVGTLTPSALR